MTRQRTADVVIPVYADVAVTKACVESVLACSGEALGRVIVIEDCSPDAAMAPMLDAMAATDPRLLVVHNERNLGFVGSTNRGIFLRHGDVVLLNSDTVVTPGWLVELLAVAYADERVSCVTPLSNNATICSVPRFPRETKAEELPDAGSLVAGSRIPRVTECPTGVGFCLLLKNGVLNMMGALDPVYGRGYNEENDWVQRSQRLGFKAVRANHVFVYHLGAVSFGEERNDLEKQNGARMRARYPHYLRAVAKFCSGPEARVAAFEVHRRLGRVQVCLDLRSVEARDGVGESARAPELQLARSLREHTEVELTAYVETPEQAALARHLEIEVKREEELTHAEIQVLHRPGQLRLGEDVRRLLEAPAHLVLSCPELVSYRSPASFGSYEEFATFKALAYGMLQAAQGVIAVSDYNRQEIVRELHVPEAHVHTVYPGIDVERFAHRDEARSRKLLKAAGVRSPYFLYVGGDAPHENLKLLVASYARLRARAGEGAAVPELVLAGPSCGSRLGFYRHLEQARIPGVRWLGEVAPDTHVALCQDALAFVYLSAYESFGRPALEAMAAGAPVLCGGIGALPEVAGDAALYVHDFSDDEIAERLRELWQEPSRREALGERGRERAQGFTWRACAERTAEVYARVIAEPSAASLTARTSWTQLANALVQHPFLLGQLRPGR